MVDIIVASYSYFDHVNLQAFRLEKTTPLLKTIFFLIFFFLPKNMLSIDFRERKGKRNINRLPQVCALTWY